MFKESYILDSMQIEVWESLADVYSVVENYDQSDFFYEKILLKSPNNLTACNNYAYYLSNRNKDLDKALILAQRALDGNSESSEYLDTYGWIKFKLGDYQVALEFVEKSLQYNDTHSEVYGHLADIYLMLGNIVEAKKALDKALVIDPDNIKLLEKRKLLETK
ncbi:hypothetical protein SDC9_166183 [bioreactor metagenome]|uniref:Tetratricopeptide repeat protein n=1 Tax=bioreactor metagenome TaxID=1076179 RepID=A0A645FWB9_9ZZZZ